MTTPSNRRLLGQFSVPQAAALRRTVTTMQRQLGSEEKVNLRQATIVSVDDTTPPTCTVTFDGTVDVPGIRRLNSYAPEVNQLVEVLIRPSGNPFILGALA